MELASFESGEHPLKRELVDAVAGFDADRPRSTQTTIGPSEIGEPCTRKLAYRLTAAPPASSSPRDKWAAIQGTAKHEYVAKALEAVNHRLGRLVWLVEQPLAISPPLVPRGNCDALHVPTGRVVDHKFPGQTKFREYAKHGPSPIYRTQGHVYGYGWAQAGFSVNEVAVAFYPPSGPLSGLAVWSEPYDEAVALAALERAEDVLAVARSLPIERFTEIPKTPGDPCRYCDWFQPGPDTGATCPGDMEM